PSDRRESFLSLLAEVGDANDLARLLDARTFTFAAGHDAGQHARVLAALARPARVRIIRPAGDASAALFTLCQPGTNDSLRVVVLQLARQWKLEALKGEALFAAFC